MAGKHVAGQYRQGADLHAVELAERRHCLHGLCQRSGQHVGGVAMTGTDTWSFTTSGVADCPCTMFESDATPATPDVNDPELDRARGAVPARRQRLDHGHQVLQGHRQHRYPHRNPVVVYRDVARHRHVHQRDRIRLADAAILDARSQ